MPTASFDQWLNAVFDHPVEKHEWYWGEDFEDLWDRLQLSDAITVEYMIRLFLAPDCLTRYSIDQVAQGFWFLLNESTPGKSAYALLNSDVPLSKRIDCIRAMVNFFRAFVVPRAPGKAKEEEDEFQGICYMW